MSTALKKIFNKMIKKKKKRQQYLPQLHLTVENIAVRCTPFNKGEKLKGSFPWVSTKV